MTEKPYLTAPLVFEFTANIVDRSSNDDGTSTIILDSTYFYPTGGGQSHDLGTINDLPIVNVRKEGETVVHVVDGQIDADTITGKIDQTHRLGNMQAHTGQHILSAAFLDVLDADTVAVKMSATGLSTVDVTLSDLTDTQIDAVEDLANSIIRENRTVKMVMVAPDAPELAKLRRPVKFDKVTGDVRLVEIVDFDVVACAGTHFPATGMLGFLKILKVENYKGGSRVSFAVGTEAMAQFRHYQRNLDAVSQLLSAGTDGVYELVEKIQKERTELYKQVESQKQQLLAYEADELIQKYTDGIVKVAFIERDNNDLRTLANVLVNKDASVAVLANQIGGDVTLIVAVAETSDSHAGNLLKAILADFDGRGGGRDNYAQGVLKGFDDIEALMRSVDTHLS